MCGLSHQISQCTCTLNAVQSTYVFFIGSTESGGGARARCVLGYDRGGEAGRGLKSENRKHTKAKSGRGCITLFVIKLGEIHKEGVPKWNTRVLFVPWYDTAVLQAGAVRGSRSLRLVCLVTHARDL